MKELERELLESTRINREIETQWAEIATKDIPQELYQEIAIQYKAASKLLASKDDIIKNLQTELKVTLHLCFCLVFSLVAVNNCLLISTVLCV